MNLVRLLVVSSWGLLTACAKDIRPESARTWRSVPTSAGVKGRALLEASAEAHGIDAWQGLAKIELDAVDTWNVGLFRQMMTPLQERSSTMTYTFTPGSGFEGEGVITSGKHAGDRFGVAGEPGPDSYVVRDGKRKQRGGLPAKIYAPSVQFFTEFPFRILEAEQVAFVDQVEWMGRPHDRVIATWGGLDAHMGHDQYLLYLDADDHTLSAIRYTVRVAGPPLASAILFDDLRPVDGMTLPFQSRVGFFGDDDVREIHRLEVTAMRTTARNDALATPSAEARR